MADPVHLREVPSKKWFSSVDKGQSKQLAKKDGDPITFEGILRLSCAEYVGFCGGRGQRDLDALQSAARRYVERCQERASAPPADVVAPESSS